MGPNVRKLASIATAALCGQFPQVSKQLIFQAGSPGRDLLQLLNHKNGFYAFESALHVFPAGCKDSYIDLESWNRPDSWRERYGSVTAPYLFFAEDIFGVQFGLNENGIYKFDPETAEVEDLAADLDEWARRILADYEYETGHPLAHEWQAQHGPLALGKRLLPKVPFVLGGTYELDNLYAADALKGMEFRADMWKQIKDLPDGTQVRMRIVK